MNKITKQFSFAAGTAMALSLSGTAAGAVDSNPFGIEEFGGLRIAEAGQGQCGGNANMKDAAEAKCGAKEKAATEANCGAKEKTTTEANCGAKEKTATEANCGAEKTKPIREASCGEAKCGASK